MTTKIKEDDYVEKIINQAEYGLDFSQQDFIKKNVKDMSLLTLTQKVFDDSTVSDRDQEYYDVRRFVRKIKGKSKIPKFDQDQIDFIDANIGAMNAWEMGKQLFDNPKIPKLSGEVQAISRYIKAVAGLNEDEEESDRYIPPKSNVKVVQKINRADPNANWNPKDLAPFEKKGVHSLKSYLHTSRFIHYIDVIDDPDLKDLFETEFIKSVYDKPDLNSEELNMFVTLCSEYVTIQMLEKRKFMLGAKIDDTFDPNADGDSGKLYMTWVEQYNNVERDLNNAKKRAKELATLVSGTRVNRMKAESGINDSLARFVSEWKAEENRQRALRIAEARKLKLKEEIERLEDESEYIANIMGIGKDEILEM